MADCLLILLLMSVKMTTPKIIKTCAPREYLFSGNHTLFDTTDTSFAAK